MPVKHRGIRSLLLLFLALLTGCGTANVPGGPPAPNNDSSRAEQNIPEPTVVAENLRIPWAIAFLPSGEMLVTERGGTLLKIGERTERIAIKGVRERGEGGLLGIAVHPNFPKNGWIYLYLTTATDEGSRNRVVRYRLDGSQLKESTEIITDIPGAIYHDGGCLAFGPDGYLYITTGDAGNGASAQDKNSLAGKNLRLRDDGSIPADNPFGTAVYSYGHRNPQGLAWDHDGQLWSTEHGRSGVQTGFDELNRIVAGGNYGWPEIQGSETRDGMIAPVLHSGPTTTWAPASALFHDGSIFFGGLRGEALYEAVLPTETGGAVALKKHLSSVYGRIRAVTIGPDGGLYISTSNRDGRGDPIEADDRIVRIDPNELR